MCDPKAGSRAAAEPVLRASRRTRRVRRFTDEPLTAADLAAIVEVARWTGSSENRQPWIFILLGDRIGLDTYAAIMKDVQHLRSADPPLHRPPATVISGRSSATRWSSESN